MDLKDVKDDSVDFWRARVDELAEVVKALRVENEVLREQNDRLLARGWFEYLTSEESDFWHGNWKGKSAGGELEAMRAVYNRCDEAEKKRMVRDMELWGEYYRKIKEMCKKGNMAFPNFGFDYSCYGVQQGG